MRSTLDWPECRPTQPSGVARTAELDRLRRGLKEVEDLQRSPTGIDARKQLGAGNHGDAAQVVEQDETLMQRHRGQRRHHADLPLPIDLSRIGIHRIEVIGANVIAGIEIEPAR